MASTTRRHDGEAGAGPWIRRAARGWAACCAALLCSAASAGSLAVTWRHGLLSITAADTPRADVLREVAQKTGAKIHGLERLGDRVTLQLSDSDLGSALRTLAADGNYALIETPPRRQGEATQYELFIAERGPGTPRPDVMRPERAVSVLVEDPRTGEMRPQPVPMSPPGPHPNPVRPDQEPVSVRVNND